MNINRFWLRASGVFGILGGLILFGGDMLFYYIPESTDLIKNTGHVSDFRIMASGVSALLGTWFYLLGLGQLNYAFRPASLTARNLVLICFAGIFVIYGIVHGAYVAIATSAKLAVQNQLEFLQSIALARQTNDVLRLFAYPLLALLSFVFIGQVWKKKTLYPRWVIAFFPLFPFLLKEPIVKILSGKMLIIINGGYMNLIIVLFFLASTVALWDRKQP